MILQSGPFLTLIWGWDNAPVLTAAVAKNWFTARTILLIADLPYSPDFKVSKFKVSKVEGAAG